MNPIQAIGSTLTYLQRYTLIQAVGLAVTNDDDGSAAGGAETITSEQADSIKELIEQTVGESKFFAAYPRLDRKIENLLARDFATVKTTT